MSSIKEDDDLYTAIYYKMPTTIESAVEIGELFEELHRPKSKQIKSTFYKYDDILVDRSFKLPGAFAAEPFQEKSCFNLQNHNLKPSDASAKINLPCQEGTVKVCSLTRSTINESLEEKVAEAQSRDSEIQTVLSHLRLNDKPNGKSSKYFEQLSSLIINDNVLFRKWESASGSKFHLQMVVPKSLQAEVLNDAHEGHKGIYTTMKILRRRFYWITGKSDVIHNNKHCSGCNDKRKECDGSLQHFVAGETVWLRKDRGSRGKREVAHKPYVIAHKLNDVTYRIKRPKIDNKPMVVSGARLHRHCEPH